MRLSMQWYECVACRQGGTGQKQHTVSHSVCVEGGWLGQVCEGLGRVVGEGGWGGGSARGGGVFLGGGAEREC